MTSTSYQNYISRTQAYNDEQLSTARGLTVVIFQVLEHFSILQFVLQGIILLSHIVFRKKIFFTCLVFIHTVI